LTEWTTRAFNLKKATGAVFLDVEKAFDRVWHKGLLHKLRAIALPTILFNVIKSYLKDRVFDIRVGDARSPLRPLTAGVPQRISLSPLLFALYVRDVPQPDDPHTRIALYADDTAIYSSSKSPALLRQHLQYYLVTLANWCRRWKITINAEKSKALFITKKCTTPLPPLTFENKVIPWCPQAKYLGVIIRH
jgi:hypothetical protein